MDKQEFSNSIQEEISRILASHIGGPESRFRMDSFAVKKFGVSRLTENEASLLFAMDNVRSLSEIAQELGWSALKTAEVLYGLSTVGLVERIE